MKKIMLSLLLVPASFIGSQAQHLSDLLNKVSEIKNEDGVIKANQTLGTYKKAPTSSTYLGNEEIGKGLREALKLGAQTATKNLAATNGFLGNRLIKIMMPAEVQTIEAKMRQLGMGAMVDKAIVAMNRAAEDASSSALPILVNAIGSLSIQDGMQILNGGENAATNLLRTRTSTLITASFRPIIANSMNKYHVDQLWAEVFTLYNKLSVVKNPVNTDLTGYVTERALSGLFTSIGAEEKKIRLDPIGTGSDIIARVFSAKR
jgi:hypothetical protein